MRHELTKSSNEQTLRSATPSRVATDDPQTVEPSGEGGHRLPEGSISATGIAGDELRALYGVRDPLTDPRAGDIVADSQGAVIEVTDVELGRYASVSIREDSTTYTMRHEMWREIVRGGRVIHRANLCPTDEGIQTPTSREVHGEGES